MPSTDATARIGDLPERGQYDIHCPLYGGPSFKMNYLSASCRGRQDDGSCKRKDCPRYVVDRMVKRADKPVKIQKTRAKKSTEGSPSKPSAVSKTIEAPPSQHNKKRVAACADCGEERTIVARGLCGTCLNRHKRAGTLDDLYPPKRNTGRPKQRRVVLVIGAEDEAWLAKLEAESCKAGTELEDDIKVILECFVDDRLVWREP